MNRSQLLFVVLSLGGCNRAEPAPLPEPAVASQPAAVPVAQKPQLGPHHSPITVQLSGPEQVSAGQDIEVVAEIEQRAGSVPVELKLQLPDGVRLVSGEATELLPVGNGKLQRRFVVHVDRVPTTDIEVVADTSSNSFGAHAKSAYRFGRPEPRFTQPPRSGVPLTVGGREVGRPIQLK
jgi:hypothetical protein